MAKRAHRPSSEIDRSPDWVFTLVASLAAFSTYFCMYAFRKPFAAGEFKGTFSLFGATLELKAALVLSQIIGYACSKYLGIKICSEAAPGRRAATLVGLIVAAETALVLFGIVPDRWKVLAIFLNGLPLGMIWGLVVWYLEGRRTTEILLAAMSCSFVVSSGVVKAAGLWIMNHCGVSEGWMPAATGICFLPLFAISVWVLALLPKPNAADIAAREARRPMDGKDRLAFLRQFFVGMALLCVVYFFLTAYRDIRDNYQVDVLKSLGYANQPELLAITETVVGLVLMVPLGALFLVRDNRRALHLSFVVMFGGTILLGLATLWLDRGWISGAVWMALIGLGAYLAYLPYNTLLFERLMASTRFAGTAVFAISLADATGYTGSVLVQLCKEFAFRDMNWLRFLRVFTYFMSGVGTICLAAALAYFLVRVPKSEVEREPTLQPLDVREEDPLDRAIGA